MEELKSFLINLLDSDPILRVKIYGDYMYKFTDHPKKIKSENLKKRFMHEVIIYSAYDRRNEL